MCISNPIWAMFCPVTCTVLGPQVDRFAKVTTVVSDVWKQSVSKMEDSGCWASWEWCDVQYETWDLSNLQLKNIDEVYKISRWLVITSRPDFFLMINGNHPQNALFLLFSGWRIILTQPNDICYAWLLWSFPIFALPGSLFMNISNTFHQAAWGG